MSQPSDEQAVPPHARVIQMFTAYWISRGLYAAARLGIADELKNGAREASELASKTGMHAEALYRVLRMLASFGIFTEVSKGKFENTELGATLCSDHPGLARSTILAFGSESWWSTWGEIMHSLKTGAPSFDKAVGKGIFDHYAENPEEAGWFNDAMIGFHGAEPPAVAKAYDSTGVEHLVDVGGGSGNLITSILRAHPRIRGTLFDLPHVAAVAKTRIAELGLAERCGVESGSFFEAVPEGDAYIMSHIIHDWDEERCLTILGNCRKASPHAKIQLIEFVLPEGDEPHLGKLADLVMLTVPGGKERTEAEYRELFEKAGYRLNQVVPTESPVSIIEAVPA